MNLTDIVDQQVAVAAHANLGGRALLVAAAVVCQGPLQCQSALVVVVVARQDPLPPVEWVALQW